MTPYSQISRKHTPETVFVPLLVSSLISVEPGLLFQSAVETVTL